MLLYIVHESLREDLATVVLGDLESVTDVHVLLLPSFLLADELGPCVSDQGKDVGEEEELPEPAMSSVVVRVELVILDSCVRLHDKY